MSVVTALSVGFVILGILVGTPTWTAQLSSAASVGTNHRASAASHDSSVNVTRLGGGTLVTAVTASAGRASDGTEVPCAAARLCALDDTVCVALESVAAALSYPANSSVVAAALFADYNGTVASSSPSSCGTNNSIASSSSTVVGGILWAMVIGAAAANDQFVLIRTLNNVVCAWAITDPAIPEGLRSQLAAAPSSMFVEVDPTAWWAEAAPVATTLRLFLHVGSLRAVLRTVSMPSAEAVVLFPLRSSSLPAAVVLAVGVVPSGSPLDDATAANDTSASVTRRRLLLQNYDELFRSWRVDNRSGVTSDVSHRMVSTLPPPSSSSSSSSPTSLVVTGVARALTIPIIGSSVDTSASRAIRLYVAAVASVHDSRVIEDNLASDISIFNSFPGEIVAGVVFSVIGFAALCALVVIGIVVAARSVVFPRASSPISDSESATSQSRSYSPQSTSALPPANLQPVPVGGRMGGSHAVSIPPSPKSQLGDSTRTRSPHDDRSPDQAAATAPAETSPLAAPLPPAAPAASAAGTLTVSYGTAIMVAYDDASLMADLMNAEQSCGDFISAVMSAAVICDGVVSGATATSAIVSFNTLLPRFDHEKYALRFLEQLRQRQVLSSSHVAVASGTLLCSHRTKPVLVAGPCIDQLAGLLSYQRVEQLSMVCTEQFAIKVSSIPSTFGFCPCDMVRFCDADTNHLVVGDGSSVTLFAILLSRVRPESVEAISRYLAAMNGLAFESSLAALKHVVDGPMVPMHIVQQLRALASLLPTSSGAKFLRGKANYYRQEVPWSYQPNALLRKPHRILRHPSTSQESRGGMPGGSDATTPTPAVASAVGGTVMLLATTAGDVVPEVVAGGRFTRSAKLLGEGRLGRVFLGMSSFGKPIAMRVTPTPPPKSTAQTGGGRQHLSSLLGVDDDERTNDAASSSHHHDGVDGYAAYYAVRRWVTVTTRLTHRHMASTWCCLCVNDRVAVQVMELVPGNDLHWFATTFSPPFKCVQRIASELLDLLRYLETQQVVHRGLCPSSVLIGMDGCTKVAGWQLAMCRAVAGDLAAIGGSNFDPASLMSASQMECASPEVRERLDAATAASDIYAFAVIVAKLLLGMRTRIDAATVGSKLHGLATLSLDERQRAASFIAPCLSLEPASRPAARELALHSFVTRR